MIKHFSIYEREKTRKSIQNERKKSRSGIYGNSIVNQKSSVMNQEMLNYLLGLGKY